MELWDPFLPALFLRCRLVWLFLFPNMKEPLQGIRFQSPDDIVRATKASLNDLDEGGFRDAFESLVRRLEKFVRNEGRYIE